MLSHLNNLLGWSTNRKVVVIESDDWGSDRFINKDIRDKYIADGYPIHKCWMSNVDIFESNKDLEQLLDVLNDFSNKPKITLLFNPANPDFGQIAKDKFTKYHYVSVKEKSESFLNSNNLVTLYRKAQHDGIIELAFHGREHLYVNRWLRDLRLGEKEVLKGFENHFWGFSNAYMPSLKHGYRSSFALDLKDDLTFQQDSIIDGLNLMENIFGQKVRYFLAPDGPLSLVHAKTLIKAGVEYIGLPKNFIDQQTRKRKLFWLNRSLGNGMKVITRNAMFEPSSPKKTDWVNSCLQDISNAFVWKKPAVISTHRANYVSGLELDNRSNGIIHLRELLRCIHRHWPDVIFLTSSQLGDVMAKKMLLDEFH